MSKQRSLAGATFTLFLVCSLSTAMVDAQNPEMITEGQKKEFIKLVKSLPHKGEFFTSDSVKKASIFTNVLFALTDKDVSCRDVYPYLALSADLLEMKDSRDYGSKHFSVIKHQCIKLFWSAGLFDRKMASKEVVTYLRESLMSKERLEVLKEMLGPKYQDFVNRLNG